MPISIPRGFDNYADCCAAAYATGLRDGDRARNAYVPEHSDTEERMRAYSEYAPFVALVQSYMRGWCNMMSREVKCR